jgi:sugar phosphate isomerase/epimerase
MYTRREFGALALAGLSVPRSAFAQPGRASVVEGVRLGVQTYSFRDLPRPAGGDAVDVIIRAMTDCGIGECELFAPHIEPASTPAGAPSPAPDSPEGQKARAALRTWRLETPISHFGAIRKKFEAASLTVYAFNYSFTTSFSDAEIERGFEIAKALGAEIITASTTVAVARRVAPFAEKHRMVVAMHNHSRVDDPNEFATPESFAAAMKMSKYFKVNLDIGHFTAANYDAVAYIREHHEQITNLHLKDRKKNQGDNTPWGQGDTPIREVLQLLKRERWPIRAYVEYEYKGVQSPVDEVKTCVEYAKRILRES